MASVRTIGLFTGPYFGGGGTLGVGQPPLSDGTNWINNQHVHPQNEPKNGLSFFPENSGTYKAMIDGATMPFMEYMDFIWRVKSWKFEFDGRPTDNQKFQQNQGFNIRSEIDLLGSPKNYSFNFDMPYRGLIGGDSDIIALVQSFKYFRGSEEYDSTLAMSFSQVYKPHYFWNKNISTDYTSLDYGIVWFAQSFTGPSRITKIDYLTFKIDADRVIGTSSTNVFGETINVVDTVFSAIMSPNEWWEYDPLDGKGPLYDKNTGKKIRNDLG